ncbi:hypothetical protein C8Q70DRAFT_327789 [Cubamyces menziesii]|nr:hypothetical protein C8Q70DRAFT_327789 [Cubamyces menziesii]
MIPVKPGSRRSLASLRARPVTAAGHSAISTMVEGMVIDTADDDVDIKPFDLLMPSQHHEVGKREVALDRPAVQAPEEARDDMDEDSNGTPEEGGPMDVEPSHEGPHSMHDSTSGRRKRPHTKAGCSEKPTKRTKLQSSLPLPHPPSALTSVPHKDSEFDESSPQEPRRRFDGIPENRRSVRIEAREIHAREMQANDRAHGGDRCLRDIRSRSRAQLRPVNSASSSRVGSRIRR